ncbi:MAG: peptidoglycan-binding protein [Methanobacterium sp. ERen5]|nr:MAG: peptidoglycan-binding protein [Methanobacterium sp. ERen5]
MKELKTGDKGKQVLNLKTWLNHFGFKDDHGKLPDKTSDLFDVTTRQALKRYQRKVGLIDTGKYDEKTEQMLPNYKFGQSVGAFKDADGCYTSPRYFKDSRMKQDYGTWCALNVIQQVWKELFNIDLKESDLNKYGYTDENGTAPAGLKAILIDLAKKYNVRITIETHSKKDISWEEIGIAVGRADKAVFYHELYKNKWGHWDYCVSVCNKNIYMANSLQGTVIGYSKATMESWFGGITSDDSVYIVSRM